MRRRVRFFVDRHLQVVDRLFVVLLLLVVEHPQVEVRLEVLRVDQQGFLIKLRDLAEDIGGSCNADALREAVERVDVVRV